ncbi:ABC transporter substrate-binding protein [Candidatus Woesearchaeota archaeon]|nr:ABC transporter substrate-binding protein [Candidatus Woesearchaeota archaeon]
MKKRVNILIAVLAIAVVILLVLLYQEKIKPEKEIKTYKIGFVGDLDGGMAKSALVGAQIAIEELNSKAEVTGNKYELKVYNTNGQKGLAKNYFDKLTNEDKAIAIISAANATQSAGTLKVPAVFMGGTILKPGEREIFYWGIKFQHILYDEVFYGIQNIKSQADIKNAVLVMDKTKNTNGYNSLVDEILPLHGITLLGAYTIDENMQDLALKIKGLNPDMVIFSTNTENAIKFLKEAKNSQLQPKIFLGGFNVNINMLADNHAELPEIVHVQNLLISINRDSAKNSGPFALFDRKIAERTSNGTTNAVHLNAYDAVNMIGSLAGEKLLNAGNIEKQREELAKAVWEIKNYKATRGTVFADGKTGYLRRDYNRIAVLTNGNLSILSP